MSLGVVTMSNQRLLNDEGAGHGRQVEQKVIIRSNNLLFHFSGHNNDLVVLKQ